MGRRKKSNGTSRVPLSNVLLELARGETVNSVAERLGVSPAEVAAAVQAHARSLGQGEETRGIGSTPVRATVRADGASRGNPGEAGVGWVIESGGRTLVEGYRYIGRATNNVAEYEAVLEGLERAHALGIRDVAVALDSQLVVRQVQGEYRVRDPKLIRLHARLKHLIGRFSACRVEHVGRDKNRRADRLANQAIDEAKKRTQG